MKQILGSVAECTVPEKILLAALELEQQGQSPFSAEALVVSSWQKYPSTFGLKGYADQYPDSNKVLTSIMGVRGLAGRGWLAKVGQKLYTLTRDGRQIVRRLQDGGDAPAAPAGVKLSRDHEKMLASLWSSSAVEKYTEGRKPELTFADACAFWNVNESMSGPAVKAQLEAQRGQFAELERLLSAGDTSLSSGRSVSAEDIQQLAEISHYLQERFSRHLNLLRSRAVRS